MGEVRFTFEVGKARRGIRRLPAPSVWLGDVFGLTRTPALVLGEPCDHTVLPRVADPGRALSAAGGALSRGR